MDPAISRPKRAILLCRISDARDGDTTGVADQERHGRAHADRLGWAIGPAATHVIIENDTSAYKRRKIKLPDGRHELRTVRPKFRRIPGLESSQTPVLEMLATGQADGLIALDLDRTVRDPRDLEDLIDVVESRHPRIPVESVTGSLRLANDADISMARVMVAIANKSSRDTARRVANARLRQAVTGQFGGGGRRYGREADGVTLREAEAEEIRQAAAKVLAGASLREITANLRQRQVPTVTGKPWTPATLRDILLRPSNYGAAVHRGEVVKEDAFPPLLADDRERAQEIHLALVRILTDPARSTTPGPAPKWLGSGIYRCGRCLPTVVTMRVQKSGSLPGRATPGYRCPACGLVRSAPRLDAYIAGTDLEQGPYGVIIQRLMRKDARTLLAPARPKVDVRALHARAIELHCKLDENQEDYDHDRKTRKQYLDSNERLRKELAAVHSQLADAAGGERPLDKLLNSADPAKAWEDLDLATRRAILKEVAVVTVLPGPRGRRPGGGYFDPSSVRVEPTARRLPDAGQADPDVQHRRDGEAGTQPGADGSR